MPEIELLVNGARHRVAAEPDRTLLAALRDELGLTGAKYGCGEGQCGACTVLIDDRPVRACLTRVAASASARITTIEGLADGDRLHPVQQAFLDCGALQCGYCTPGMVLGAVGLLAKTPAPAEPEIRRALAGHICRCGTYPRILQAVQAACARAEAGR
jgi:aerobic-type carbon monoxide dehydrogenase small subunit (CoxS/CutS family)